MFRVAPLVWVRSEGPAGGEAGVAGWAPSRATAAGAVTSGRRTSTSGGAATARSAPPSVPAIASARPPGGPGCAAPRAAPRRGRWGQNPVGSSVLPDASETVRGHSPPRFADPVRSGRRLRRAAFLPPGRPSGPRRIAVSRSRSVRGLCPRCSGYLGLSFGNGDRRRAHEFRVWSARVDRVSGTPRQWSSSHLNLAKVDYSGRAPGRSCRRRSE